MNELHRRRRPTVKDALEHAKRAVAELHRAPDWVKVVHALEATLAHADAAAKVLRDDNDELAGETEVQREVALRLVAASSAAPRTPKDWRDLEGTIHRQVLSEKAKHEPEAPEDPEPASEVKAADPLRFWACALEDAEIYRMGLPSKAAAIAALEGQAGEVICYERGFPVDVATELFDVDNLLSRAEELALADRRVLGQFDYGLFDGLAALTGDLRRRLGEAFVEWVRAADGRILAVVERADIEVKDAEDVTS